MKNDSLSLKVYTELRKKILSLQLPPNTRLKEAFWAKKIGVSRMAVREALTRLLGERLVSLGSKGGYFVTSMTHEDLNQLRELREILELGALRLAINKVTKEELGKIKKICDDFTSMVERGYYSGANEADLRFHETLIECSRNNKVIQTYNNSHIPLFHQLLIKNNGNEDDFELTDREHRAILQALKEKDLALAEKSMKLHFARGAALIALD